MGAIIYFAVILHETQGVDVMKVIRREVMRTALFWAITQRVVVVTHRRFGTTCRSHLQGCPETSELPLLAMQQPRRAQYL
jgi:hypothetical protein